MEKFTEYYLAFSYVLGIGPMKFQNLLAVFGNVKKAYEADSSLIRKTFGLKLGEDFISFRKTFSPGKELKRLSSQHIFVIPQDSDGYPQQLKHISDPPICLFAKGESSVLKKESLSIAVVGTRKATSYGLQATEHIVGDLAQRGVCIISGLALGIDAAAHKTALDQEASTIAVLGCGVNIPYPGANKPLYERILAEDGVIVSEFPPDMTVLPGLFISRNRIVSALSKGVLIIEGQEDSGSLITARYAAEQGRDVFAVPSPITSPMSHAPHILIKQGAKLVTSAQDILEEYGLSEKSRSRKIDLVGLDENSRSVVQILSEAPLLIDDIARITELSVNRTLQTLSSLELQGIVEKNTEGKYQIKL